MSFRKRLLFALFTLVLFASLGEGSARIIWWRLARKAFATTEERGKEILSTTIHFMAIPHPLYGYVLKPGFQSEHLCVNAQGFADLLEYLQRGQVK